MCCNIYKQGRFQEAPLPSPTTTHVHCFINITFQGSIWKSTHLTSPRLLLFFSFLFFFLFPHKSFDSKSFFFSFPFFLTNLLVADLSSSSSYLDRIGLNWGYFGQFLGQLWGISTDFSRFDHQKKKKWRISTLKQVGCECSGTRAAPVLPRFGLSKCQTNWIIWCGVPAKTLTNKSKPSEKDNHWWPSLWPPPWRT